MFFSFGKSNHWIIFWGSFGKYQSCSKIFQIAYIIRYWWKIKPFKGSVKEWNFNMIYFNQMRSFFIHELIHNFEMFCYLAVMEKKCWQCRQGNIHNHLANCVKATKISGITYIDVLFRFLGGNFFLINRKLINYSWLLINFKML